MAAVTEPKASLTPPITSGITAPPAIAMQSSPESSALRSGIRSMRIEKIRGKTLPKPSPVTKIDATATSFEPSMIPRVPRTLSAAVTTRNWRADMKFSTAEPMRRPIERATKKKAMPPVARLPRSNWNFWFRKVAIQEFTPTSAPT